MFPTLTEQTIIFTYYSKSNAHYSHIILNENVVPILLKYSGNNLPRPSYRAMFPTLTKHTSLPIIQKAMPIILT